MRKILLATTALVSFAVAGAAQAATAPLNVTVGGSVDFVAGAFHEAIAAGATDPSSGDFETVYSLAFGVTGKAANGLAYGGDLVLDNDVDAITYAGNSNGIEVTKATVFMSGAYGKIQLGDARGATELAVTAPSVAGIRYIDFLNTSNSFAKDLVVGIDGKDHSTNVTYYTPSVGNDMGKVQAAVTYVPNFTEYGSDVQLTVPGTTYRNVIKGAVAYTGNIQKVAVNASADIVSGTIDSATVRDFTAWGLGLAGAYQGFTLGAAYADNASYNTTAGQKKQHVLTAGLKYEFSKYAIGFDYLNGEGQSSFVGAAGDRVKSLDTYSFGGTYTWAPGLTTTANAVLFDQNAETAANDNSGYVLLISQKLAF